MAPPSYRGWAPYVPVRQRRANARREAEKLRKKGHKVAPIEIDGRLIANTFWGKAWCENLESYRDYDNRLPRGRTYVRNGSVIDLQIAPKEITALVSGSSIYTVTISIKALPAEQWQAICRDCAGGIDSLVELLQGQFSKGVMERLCRQDQGLFPKPSEIRFSCTCPDGAVMCKHVAAVLYGVGARLDQQSDLLFRLRDVNENDLVADLDQALPVSSQPIDDDKLLETDDISALFGFDMEDVETVPTPEKNTDPVPAAPAERKRAAPKKAGSKTTKASGAKKSASKKPIGTKQAAPSRKTVKKADSPKDSEERTTASRDRKPRTPNAPKDKQPPKKEKKSRFDYELTPDGYVKWWK